MTLARSRPVRSIRFAVIAACLLTLAQGRAARGAGLTVNQVYAKAQATLAGAGKIYHAVVTTRTTRVAQADRTELWADGRSGVVRVSFHVSNPPGTVTRIERSDLTVNRVPVPKRPKRYMVVAGPPIPTCYKTGVAVAEVLGCAPPDAHFSHAVKSGTYAGHAAVIVRSHGTISGEDEDVVETIRLYLDPTTFLPVARVTTGTSSSQPFKTVASFSGGFVAASSLPSNFFNPASIGFRGVDAEISDQLKIVPATVPVYWIGMHFSGAGSLPPLAVQRATHGAAVTELYYGLESARLGFPYFYMSENYGSKGTLYPVPSGHCYRVQRLTLAGGTGTIIAPSHAAGCSNGGGASAVARFGKLQMSIQATRCCPANGKPIVNPYGTAAGMSAVLRALVRWHPAA